jgi:hypothetical protein
VKHSAPNLGSTALALVPTNALMRKFCSSGELGKHHAQELVTEREAERGIASGEVLDAIAKKIGFGRCSLSCVKTSLPLRMRAPCKKVRCAAAHWAIQIDFDSKSKTFL